LPSTPFTEHIEAMVELARELAGDLTERETRFLTLMASVLPPSLGEVLEIGSFKGKSTTILAKTVSQHGGDRIHAVDPLTLPASTDRKGEDAELLKNIFEETLHTHKVFDLVTFHHMRSQELAPDWHAPLRLLWIDGDHTYQGVIDDVANFAKHLAPGAIIAFHDVLHGFEGPVRVFCEKVLLSPDYGFCGVCGSIAWAQYIGGGAACELYYKQKLSLYRKLNRLIPHVVLGRHPKQTNITTYKMRRAMVPRHDVDIEAWKTEILKYIPKKYI